jgi:hypothetical protein
VAAGTLAATNYTFAFADGTLTVNKAHLTITADAQSKTYGDANPALTATITGFVNGDTASVVSGRPTLSTTATASSAVGSYPIKVVDAGTLGATNYDFPAAKFANGTLTVTARPITVTADAQTKVYGDADPTLTYHVTSGSLPFSDAFSGGLTRAAGEHVGTYAIQQGTLALSSNYTLTYVGANLTVTPATPAITWPDPADITYGAALGSTQLDATSSVPGTFTYTPDAGTIVHAGAGQTLSVSFTPTDRTDYAMVTATATMGVTQATPVLTISAPGGTYDGTPFPAAVTIASGIPGPNDTPAASLENATPILTYSIGAGTSGTSLGSTPPTAPGIYTVVARYPGSTDFAAVTSAPITFTINRGTAQIALATSGGSAVYGQPITMVATVTGPGTPGGTVAFTDGATLLATVPLDGSGKATLSISGLAVGSHAIIATYGGDANFLAVQSGPASESVAQAATAVVLAPHPVFRKKKVVSLGLTAEVVPVPPGGGVPTGMVTFEFLVKHGKKLKVKTLGTAALTGAEATLTVKPKAVLNKSITIIYSGDPDYQASTLTPPKITLAVLKTLARPMAADR